MFVTSRVLFQCDCKETGGIKIIQKLWNLQNVGGAYKTPLQLVCHLQIVADVEEKVSVLQGWGLSYVTHTPVNSPH